MDLAEILRGSERTTVARLAAELRVTERTLLRDLATLRARGLAIEARPGRGGGVRLARDAASPVALTLEEIVSLWLAARLSRSASDLPWGAAASTGMAKLLASLPDAKARALRALCRRVVVGPPATPGVLATAGSPPPELLRVFEEAVSSGFGLSFSYTDREGRPTTRRVEPHGLIVTPPVWYVLARDLDKGRPRSFRMDRIQRPRILRDVRFQPDLGVVRAQVPDDPRGWRPLAGSWSA